MCLLLFKPADREIPYNYLENGANSNPHGAGIAVADGERLIIQKSQKWGAKEIQKALDKFKGHPAIVHFRFATHGSKNYQNTHPFWLNDKWCAAHNGVINIPAQKDESDTRAFLRVHVKPLLKDNIGLNDNDIIQLLGEEMGNWNKMVYLSADGAVGIANEDSGHWNNGIWYSNHNYEDFSKYYDDDYAFSSPNFQKNKSIMVDDGENNYSVPFGNIPFSGAFDGHNTPCGDRKRPRLLSPPEDNIVTESWHRFDTNNLVCHTCNERIVGAFKVEAECGTTICEMCEFFGAEEQ